MIEWFRHHLGLHNGEATGSSDPAVRLAVESTRETLKRNAELRARLVVVLQRYEERAREPRRT